MEYKVDFQALPWQSPKEGVRFKVYKQDGRQLRMVRFEKGFAEASWCEKGHAGYLLEGQVEMTFDDRVVIYNAGDGIFIPDGAEHRHRAKILSDGARLLLVEKAG